MHDSVKAIVLTCQKHVPIAEHMIDRYDAEWPDHPFVFRLPDGEASRCMALRHPGRVELVPTDEGEGRGRFRAAVLGLLAGLDDEAWVWWCIDDKYVTWIDRATASAVLAIARTIDDPHVSGLCFARARHLGGRGVMAHGHTTMRGLAFLRRRDYSQIWLHQLLRVKVLRGLFDGFPERIESAKVMDDLHKRTPLPDDHRLYVLDRSAVAFGESTRRGRLTANCAESLRRGRGLPAGFEVDSESVFIGKAPGRLARICAGVMKTFRAGSRADASVSGLRSRRESVRRRVGGKAPGPRVGGERLGSFIDDRFHLTHNAGLFSCLSVTLFELVRFGRPVAGVNASRGLGAYKDRPDDDAWTTLFLPARGCIPASAYDDNPFARQLWHHADYARLEIERAAPFVREYFTPGPSVEATAERLVRRYGIALDQTIGLWFRGTDKVKEVAAVSVDRFEKSVRDIVEREPRVRLLVQTDQRRVRDRLMRTFPHHAFFLDELPVTDGPHGLHKVGSGVGIETAVTLLAVNVLMSRCRWVVTHTGNIAYWTMLLRGHVGNSTQLFDTLPAIKGRHRAA